MRIADAGRTCAIIISMFAFGVRVAFHLIEEDTSLNANGWIKENDDE